MKKVLSVIMLLCLTVWMQAQSVKVSGEVTDGSESLPGVSIQIKGTTRGTITGNDGRFVLEVKKGETLVVSYIGYQTVDLLYKGEPSLKINMSESSTLLQETVVVGYARQTKATLTGAVASVGGDAVVKRSVASLSTALQGTMPGVTIQQTSGQPGDDGSSIRIRGLGSINSNQSPLVLVDGIEMDINQVDMNTVESVSVLKDAASASIYGSRASNGVVLITTKRGREGKVSVSYSGYVTMQSPTNMPEVVDAATYLKATLDSKDNAGSTVSPSERQQTLDLIDNYKRYKADNWERYDTDWRAATMKDQSFMHSHNVTVSGGNKVLQYFASGSYLGQDGLIPNNTFDRVNIRANADAQLASWAKFSLETNLRQSTTVVPSVSSPKSIINKSLYMVPTLSAAQELDGNWGYGKNGDNPAAQAHAGGTKTSVGSEVLVNGTLTLTPLKDWDIIAQYSRRNVTSRSRTLTKPYNVSLKGINLGRYPADDGLTESLDETARNYYRVQSSYGKKINKFNGKLLLGFQSEDSFNSNFSASKRGFELGKDYLENGDGSSATASGGATDWAMMSFYGRLNFNYDETYLLELSGRYDGSSRFMPHNRWGFFPSVSAGWVISRETFMSGTSSVLDILKLRASYGLLGNQDIGNYPYAAVIEPGYGYWFDKNISTGVAQVYMANQDIVWEKSAQFNVGIDASLWNGLLSFTGDYYIKTVYDMLDRIAKPYYVGLKPAYTNYGSMENRGWEIALGHKNKVGDFNYSVNFTLSDNRNTILDLRGNNSQDKTKVEGYPLNGIWGYLTDGYYQDWNDVNSSPKFSTSARPGYVKYKKIAQGEGVDPLVIDSRDQVFLGDAFPHYTYGVNLSGSYKGFDATIFLQGVGQRSVYMNGVGLVPFSNGANLFKHQMDWWSADNPNAEYPILVPEANASSNFQKSDKWVKDGSYARLKNVVLGYTLPNRILEKAKLGTVRFYLSGQNLFTLSQFYKGYDPEVQYGGTAGGEFYPIMQTFTVGVDIKF